MIRTLCIAAAALVAMSATPVFAKTEIQTKSVTVSFRDLDLGTEQGAEEMLKRLERASRRACRRADGRSEMLTRRDYLACRAEAMETSVAQLNQSLVTERFYAQTARRMLVASK
jgi:UrcA family protein